MIPAWTLWGCFSGIFIRKSYQMYLHIHSFDEYGEFGWRTANSIASCFQWDLTYCEERHLPAEARLLRLEEGYVQEGGLVTGWHAA
ncbi:hypothetical protein Tsubulata_029107 [Turnera subulata]|uniref:Uncharacterized protein n=1 Tax=Turnera subulata TaxID=218843 RepID=A0A9Q0F832_9ROSI|nr:hypothetical protein Tsubulata_029107 [Turnera subulata]